MTPDLADEPDDDAVIPVAPRPDLYLIPGSGGPSEFADRSIREVSLSAGLHPRTPSAPPGPGADFESGGPLDASAPDGFLAVLADAVTRDGGLAELTDDGRSWVMGTGGGARASA